MLIEDDSGELFFRRIYLLISKNWCEWQSLGALFGIAIGLLSIIVGGLLWAIVHYLSAGRLGTALNLIEVVCFAWSLPLLALGAYCLDLLEQRPPVLASPARPKPSRYIYQAFIRNSRPENNRPSEEALFTNPRHERAAKRVWPYRLNVCS